VDVRLSPEQRALRDAAAQVVDRLGPQAVGALDDAERAAKLGAAVAGAGWLELRTAMPDTGGAGTGTDSGAGDGAAESGTTTDSGAGAGAGAGGGAAESRTGTDGGAAAWPDSTGRPWASGVEVGIVAEELGRGLADAAYLGPTLAGAPAAAGPEAIALVPDLSDLAAAARPAGDVLAGPAVAVDVRGTAATLVLVPGDGGYALGEIENPDATASTTATTTATGVDLTRWTAVLPAGTPVRPLADQARPLTAGDLTRWTALGLALTCADLVGTMRGAVRLAVDYAAERRQYGKAIGSFQAVQHLLADAHVATEGSRSAALHAAWAADALPAGEALAAASVAKAYCARAARTVCETAIQVHGGIGNTWECLAHVHLRRALLSADLLGGVGPSLERVLAHHVGETDHVATVAGRPGPDAPGGPDGLR
jgi:alkylation response protein AidB-like acyl-CoA dehydrogenase